MYKEDLCFVFCVCPVWFVLFVNVYCSWVQFNENSKNCRTAPREGAMVHGIFMEGARWDTQQGIIMESRLKELHPMMPVINIRVNLDKILEKYEGSF